jgi:hypothetical protein
MFHLMLEDQDSLLEEKGSKDAKAAVPVPIVCAPKSEESASSFP